MDMINGNGIKCALKSPLSSDKHTGRHASATEWNYYLNKGMVLVLLRDESLIGNKNTKYL